MPEQTTIVIVDDHAIVRQGVRAFLDIQPDLLVLGEADSGEAAISLASELVPDVVLMDLVMPGIDGVEATRRVKLASPHSQIIVLTSYHEDEYIFPGFACWRALLCAERCEPGGTCRDGTQGCKG